MGTFWENFWTYYVICFIYCSVMSLRRYYKNDSTWNFGTTPGLDVVVIVFICWVQAPVDLFLTLRRLYKEHKTVE